MSSLLRSPWVINGQHIFRQTCPRGISMSLTQGGRKSEKSKRACSSIRDFRVLHFIKMCPIFVVGSVHNFGWYEDDII